MPQLLGPERYFSESQLQQEMELLFLPGWHLGGTLSELPNDGDFMTTELLGHPLIYWRADGQINAFLNVCAHRMAMLTHKPCGSMGRLRCQYHGWEYDETGNTRKIPDAKSFRPLEPGIVGLRKFRTETVGNLFFVNLSDDGPSLREYLGPGYDLAEEISTNFWEPTGNGNREMNCNWKIYLENTTETYHAEAVHPTTLRVIPDEKTCEHTFHDDWSLLKTFGKPDNLDFLDRTANWMLRVQRDLNYHNLLIYPNIAIGKMSLFSWVDEALPDGPNRMKIVARGFSHTGRPGILPRIARPLVRRWGNKFFTKLVSEDAAVLPDVQTGLTSPVQPKGGLISTREERVFEFQKYIQRTTSPDDGVGKPDLTSPFVTEHVQS